MQNVITPKHKETRNELITKMVYCPIVQGLVSHTMDECKKKKNASEIIRAQLMPMLTY